MEALSSTQRANFRHLYLDIFWYGILAGSTIAFLSIYVARLGGNSFQISLLTAIPAVTNLFLSLPAGKWLEKQDILRAAIRTLYIHRIGYLFLFLLPWLFPPRWEIWAIVLVTLAMYIPGTAQAISFNSLFASAVPAYWRAEVVGRRYAIQAFCISATSILCGQILDRVAFPFNYQIVFAIGGISGMLSAWAVARIRMEKSHAPEGITRPECLNVPQPNDPASDNQPKQTPRPTGKGSKPSCSIQKKLSQSLRFDLLRTPFGSFMGAYLFFYLVQYVPIPLFPLMLVRVIHLNDTEISLANALFYISMFIGSLGIGRLSRRYGHRRVLVASGGAIFMFPLIYALARGAGAIWFNNLIGGVIWAGVNNATINRLMERVPEDDRPAHMALHNLVMNLGMLSGSLLGPALGETFGLREAMLIATALRMLGGILLWKYG